MSGLPSFFYRLVRAQEARVSDFQSVMVSESRMPNAVERAQPELWAGISMFDSEAGARRIGQGKPERGTWIAAVRLEAVDPDWIVIGPVGKRGHCTVWASPRRLLDAVAAVTPV